jgi:hypothetical protein
MSPQVSSSDLQKCKYEYTIKQFNKGLVFNSVLCLLKFA